MLNVAIPGWTTLALAHLVLDVNGTVSLDGRLLPAAAERIARLRPLLAIHLLSADTYGTLDAIATALSVPAVRLTDAESHTVQKARYVGRLGAASVVAVGNGANDEAMLREAALGIAVLGPEGLAVASLLAADVVAASIADALDLLLQPRRLVATLRR